MMDQKNQLTDYVIVYTDDKHNTRQERIQSNSAEQAWKQFQKMHPNYRIQGIQDWE